MPDLNKNLFSVGACMSKNYRVTFKNKSVKLFLDNELMAQGVQCDNNLFNMIFKIQSTDSACPVMTSLRRWHDRLDHVSYKYIRQMNKNGLIGDSIIEDVKETKDLFYEACQYDKHRLPFKSSSREKPRPGELIHSDICHI